MINKGHSIQLFPIYDISRYLLGIYEQPVNNIPECGPGDVRLTELLHTGNFTEVYKAASLNIKGLKAESTVVVKKTKGC